MGLRKRMRQPMRIIFCTIILIIAAAVPISSQEITTNIINRVFHIKIGNKEGSGFAIEVDNRQYLITARHLVDGLKDGDTIEIHHENKWKTVKVKPFFPQIKEVDVAVLVLPVQIAPPLPIDLSLSGLVLAQDMYFLGFPYGLFMEGRPIDNFFPLPFVKKGICSGMAKAPQDYSVVFIDGYNNPGFSGGPIVFIDTQTKKLKIGGVVSAYRNQEDKVIRKLLKKKAKAKNNVQPDQIKEVETNMVVKTNAGIVIGFGIQSALDVISKNPVGPLVK